MGLLGMTVTGDAFNLYVLLEIASLASYALIAMGEDGAPLASFNYVIMGTIGACFYLLGVGYLYIATGSLNMADFSQFLPNLYHSKTMLRYLAFLMVGDDHKNGIFSLAWMASRCLYSCPFSSKCICCSHNDKGGGICNDSGHVYNIQTVFLY